MISSPGAIEMARLGNNFVIEAAMIPQYFRKRLGDLVFFILSIPLRGERIERNSQCLLFQIISRPFC